MAATVLADVKFQSNEFVDSVGIVFKDKLAMLNNMLIESRIQPSTGYTQSMTAVNTPTGDSVQITTGLTSVVNSVTQYQDIAAWVEREKVWGFEEVLNNVAGVDLTPELASFLATYWAGELHKSALSLLDGVFTTALASTHVLDESDQYINTTGLTNAKQKLGDAGSELSTFVANSAVLTRALQAGILYQEGTIGGVMESGNMNRIVGMTPFASDLLTGTGGVYPSYLGKPGSLVFKFRQRKPSRLNNANVYYINAGGIVIEVELVRNSLTNGGQDIIASRASYLVHCPGVQFDGTVTSNPTNAELATGTTWTKVADDDRKIAIVKYLSKA